MSEKEIKNCEEIFSQGEENLQLTGVCRWFNKEKGFGFLRQIGNDVPADAPDIFFHQSKIQWEGFRSLDEGEEVQFTLVEGEDGRPQAIDIVRFTKIPTQPIKESN
ncbi:cold shock domain-containing protein [Candidatus Phytoplasma prunorum]|uniref:cold shock domain-containing protein n=1 Tax=Candidatus Phytoplasma prunorum TaxID=47565 RepID=UPI00349F36A2